jgi:hypothetical protein
VLPEFALGNIVPESSSTRHFGFGYRVLSKQPNWILKTATRADAQTKQSSSQDSSVTRILKTATRTYTLSRTRHTRILHTLQTDRHGTHGTNRCTRLAHAYTVAQLTHTHYTSTHVQQRADTGQPPASSRLTHTHLHSLHQHHCTAAPATSTPAETGHQQKPPSSPVTRHTAHHALHFTRQQIRLISRLAAILPLMCCFSCHSVHEISSSLIIINKKSIKLFKH